MRTDCLNGWDPGGVSMPEGRDANRQMGGCGCRCGTRCCTARTPELEITLAHGTASETETRDQLQRLLKQYDLAGYGWTRKVVIESGAIPHSHPVLTLNTRHSEDDLLLSTFVHEQYHWYETSHPKEIEAAAVFQRAYPGLPVGGLDGAADEESTYMHIVVCYAEWHEMKRRAGEERARKAMEYCAKNHYR